MNVISLEKNTLVFVPQSLEDLWVIKTISDVGDLISGQSYRRTRGDEQDDSSTRKSVFVSIAIEKFDFSNELTSLRFTGKIKESRPNELAPLDEYHTLEIQLNKTYSLNKEHFYEHQLDLLSSNTLLQSVVVIVLDDEVANIFLLTNTDAKEITSVFSKKHGKRYASDFDFSTYYSEILQAISKFDTQIIIAGPGTIKSKLSSFLRNKIKSLKILEINISNTQKSSFQELFKKPEVSNFFKNSIVYKEQKIFDKFLENLGKDNKKAIYGLQEIESAINYGSIETILVSEELWKKNIDDISLLIKNAEKQKMVVHIVDSTHDTHSAIKSFGGIIANLRYSLV